MSVECSECKIAIVDRKERYRNDKQKFYFCSPKCKYRFYRKLKFRALIPYKNNPDIPDREKMLVDLPVSTTFALRPYHIKHKIAMKRFTLVAMYCEQCKQFIGRTHIRKTLTRHEIRLLTWPDYLRDKWYKNHPDRIVDPNSPGFIKYDPEKVKAEMELREQEEQLDEVNY